MTAVWYKLGIFLGCWWATVTYDIWSFSCSTASSGNRWSRHTTTHLLAIDTSPTQWSLYLRFIKIWLPWATSILPICSCLRSLSTEVWKISIGYVLFKKGQPFSELRILSLVFRFLFVIYLRPIENGKWFASECVGWPKAAFQGPGCPLNVASPDFDLRKRLGAFLHFTVCSIVGVHMFTL